jgi:hypothetical protein
MGNLPPKKYGGCRSSRLLLCPNHNSTDSYLIVHPDQGIKVSKALKVTLLILPVSLQCSPWTQDQERCILSIALLINKASCAKLYVILWQKAKYVKAGPLIRPQLQKTDLNLEHLWLLNPVSFVLGFKYQNL